MSRWSERTSVTHSLTHSLTHFGRSLVLVRDCSFVRSFVRSFDGLFVRWFSIVVVVAIIRSFVRSLLILPSFLSFLRFPPLLLRCYCDSLLPSVLFFAYYSSAKLAEWLARLLPSSSFPGCKTGDCVAAKVAVDDGVCYGFGWWPTERRHVVCLQPTVVVV